MSYTNHAFRIACCRASARLASVGDWRKASTKKLSRALEDAYSIALNGWTLDDKERQNLRSLSLEVTGSTELVDTVIEEG